MRNPHSAGRLAAALVCGVLAATVVGGVAHASPGGAGASPPGGTIGEYDHIAAPAVASDPMSAKKALAGRTPGSGGPVVGGTRVTANTIPVASTLGVQYQIQQDPAWCGPTTLEVILQYKGMGFGGATQWDQQHGAANLLGTTSAGTPWYGSDNVPYYPGTSWYPMQDALNYVLYAHGIPTSQFVYLVQAVNAGNSTDVSNFAYALRVDIGVLGWPFAMNEYAAPGYQVGRQPGGQWIMHWMVANGYSDNGNSVVFEDPGWGGGSPSYDSSARMITAIAGRGYVW